MVPFEMKKLRERDIAGQRPPAGIRSAIDAIGALTALAPAVTLTSCIALFYLAGGLSLLIFVPLLPVSLGAGWVLGWLRASTYERIASAQDSWIAIRRAPILAMLGASVFVPASDGVIFGIDFSEHVLWFGWTAFACLTAAVAYVVQRDAVVLCVADGAHPTQLLAYGADLEAPPVLVSAAVFREGATVRLDGGAKLMIIGDRRGLATAVDAMTVGTVGAHQGAIRR